MKCSCGKNVTVNFERESSEKTLIINGLVDRLNKYFARYGMLPDDDSGVPAAPSLLLDRQPASDIKAHVSMETGLEHYDAPSLLLGK